MCEQHGENFVRYQNYNHFVEDEATDQRVNKKYGSEYFDFLENEITEDERRINELIDSYNKTNEHLENLIDKKAVYDKASQLILTGEIGVGAVGSRDIQDDENHTQVIGMETIAGVIKAEDELKMKRMVFRVSRGRGVPTFFDLITEKKSNVFLY